MNITLISSNSYRINDSEIRKIFKEDYISINMNKSSISNILDEANYFSFMDTYKNIVVRNADFFGSEKTSEEEINKLIKYLEQPNPNTNIIFTTLNGIDLRKKQVKIIKDKYNLINIPNWDKKKIREEANKYLQEKGYSMDYNSIYYLLDNTYNNIDILFNELDKIMLYYNKPCTIKIADVMNIVGREVDSNSFHFVNAVIEKNLEGSIRIMKNLKIYKVDSIALINLLSREYRLMYYIKKMKDNKSDMSEICKNLSLQEWQVSKLYNNGLKYSEKELLKDLYLLGDIDLKIKKGIYDKDTALYAFLLEGCI